MDGPHSPFGVIWQVTSATGWSLRHILWSVNYQTLVMMLSDQTRYVSGEQAKRRKTRKEKTGRGSGMFEFFQSKLNDK